jgi:protease I
MSMSLHNRSIAILIAPRGTEDAEFSAPREAVERASGKVTVVGLEAGTAETNKNDLDPGETYQVDQVVSATTASEFDGLIIPGGCVGADKLRGSDEVVSFVRSFFEQEKPVAVICHGPWLLVEAGVLHNRTVTSFPALEKDIANAGGIWVDQEVVVDNGLVTSRKPEDLPAFCAKIVEEFGEGPEADQASGV